MTEPVEEPQVEETQAAEDDWPFEDFTKADVDAWKAQYGEIHLIEDEDDKAYVMRGIGRKEFVELEAASYRNEQDYENKYTEEALLCPQLTEMQLRQMDAGDVKNLYDKIAPISGVGSANEADVEPFNPQVHGPKLPGTEAADWNAWCKAARGRKLFYVELEGMPFVFKNLNRSQYETYRTKIQNEGAGQEAAENTVSAEGVVYPIPENFKPDSNDYLYGTIASLALLIMRESGFGKAVRVTKL